MWGRLWESDTWYVLRGCYGQGSAEKLTPHNRPVREEPESSQWDRSWDTGFDDVPRVTWSVNSRTRIQILAFRLTGASVLHQRAVSTSPLPWGVQQRNMRSRGGHCLYSISKCPPSSWVQRSIGILSRQFYGFLETKPRSQLCNTNLTTQGLAHKVNSPFLLNWN